MKLRWHVLASLMLSGLTFAGFDHYGFPQAMSVVVAVSVLVAYWLVFFGLGGAATWDDWT